MKMTRSRRAGVMILAAVTAAAFALAGCGEASPTEQADGLMKALKAGDSEAAAQYYAGSKDDLDVSSMLDAKELKEAFGDAPEELGELSDTNQKRLKELAEHAREFDYVVDNEQIDGGSATVDVTVTTYNFGEAAEKTYNDVMLKSFALARSGSNGDEMARKLLNMAVRNFYTHFEALNGKNYEKTVTFKLKKKGDGTWVVKDVGGDELSDALSGGLVSALREIAVSDGAEALKEAHDDD